MPSATLGENPYPGPRPFTIAEQEKFFGRSEETDDLVTLISSARLVFLYAESGTGKSSLLNASLIPALRKEGFEVLPVVRVGDPLPTDLNLPPEKISNIFVLNTLLDWAGDALDGNVLVRGSIRKFLDQRDASRARVVIFDQFEELFTSYPERWRDRKPFLLDLAEAMEDALIKNEGLRVLFVLREDYLAVFDDYADVLPERPGVGYRLERMGREAARLAIEGPLKGTKRSFAPGVAQALVDMLLKVPAHTTSVSQQDLLAEFVEPVHLQIVCHTLWEKLPDDVLEIKEEHLKLLGDITSPLAEFYDEAVRKTVEKTRITEEEIRNWFERNLITPGKTRGTVFAGTEQTGGLPNEAVQLLVRTYLIKSEWRAGARWYELTHDRLVEPILRSNQRWREKHIKVEEKGRGRLAYLKLVGIVVFLFAAVSGTIRSVAPPADTSVSYVMALASVVTVVILLILALFLKRYNATAQKIVWGSLAFIFLVSSIVFFVNYRERKTKLTYRYPNTADGALHTGGTQLTPMAQEYVAEVQTLSTSELVMDFAGDEESVWTPASIRSARRVLLRDFVGLVLSLACMLFCILQGLSLIEMSQSQTSYVADTVLPFEASVLGFYLVGISILLIYLIFAFWPASVLDGTGKTALTPYETPAWNSRISFLGGIIEASVGPETRVIFLVICAGALGSLIHATTSFATFLGNRTLRTSWLWWYFLRPFVGMSLALVFYFVIRGGLLATNVRADAFNIFGLVGLAGLVGMFSKQASDKLTEVFTALFTTRGAVRDQTRSDKLVPDISILSIQPNTGPPHGGISVAIGGSGFNYGTQVTFGGVPASVHAISSKTILATVPDHPPGPVDVEVSHPSGSRAVLVDSFTFIE